MVVPRSAFTVYPRILSFLMDEESGCVKSRMRHFAKLACPKVPRARRRTCRQPLAARAGRGVAVLASIAIESQARASCDPCTVLPFPGQGRAGSWSLAEFG